MIFRCGQKYCGDKLFKEQQLQNQLVNIAVWGQRCKTINIHP
jgi:hypothetical protein